MCSRFPLDGSFPLSRQHTTRNRLVALERWHGPNDPRTIEARQVHKANELEEHIRRVVDAAPPLTAEQRDRLATLLRGGSVA